MYKVTAPSGETVYTHYDKWECETWIRALAWLLGDSRR